MGAFSHSCTSPGAEHSLTRCATNLRYLCDEFTGSFPSAYCPSWVIVRASAVKCPATPGEKLRCFWQHPSAEKGEAPREPSGQVRGALRAGHFAGMKLTSIPRTAVCLYVCFYFPRHISFSYLSICAPDNYTLRIQLDADLFFTSCPKFSAIKQLLCAWCNEFTQNL